MGAAVCNDNAADSLMCAPTGPAPPPPVVAPPEEQGAYQPTPREPRPDNIASSPYESGADDSEYAYDRGPTAAPSSPWDMDELAEAAPSPWEAPGAVTDEIPSRGFSLTRPQRAKVVSNVLTPTKSFINLTSGLATGLVLLTPDDDARNANVCDALLQKGVTRVMTEEEARAADPGGEHIVTHWPVSAAVDDEGDCGKLLGKYDFTRAARVMRDYGLGHLDGPIFLALDPSGEAAFLDLSEADPSYIRQATEEWIRMTLTPVPYVCDGSRLMPRPSMASFQSP